ncbi:MAG: hypothetical protein QCI00_04560 [Candidatus Thermoplasmatota archaeon]|nr:hypothetical protein [Candidatus Thermoplasmatota archaeon]
MFFLRRLFVSPEWETLKNTSFFTQEWSGSSSKVGLCRIIGFDPKTGEKN